MRATSPERPSAAASRVAAPVARALAACVALGAAAGCAGTIYDAPDAADPGPHPGDDGGPRAPDAAPDGAPPPPQPVACTPAHPDPGTAPARRLTRREYANTVQALLPGIPANRWPDLGIPSDQVVDDFENNVAGQTPSPLLVERYGTAARAVADLATSSSYLATSTGCRPTTPADEDSCGQRFVDAFGRRAFRRALTTDERQDFVGLFTTAHTSSGFATAVGMVIEAVLQSPEFLYRVDLGTAAAPGATSDLVPLGASELATRLSYFLWASPPDETLLAAAEADQLRTADQLEAQARRMLAATDPRAHDAVASFHRQWLGLDAMQNNIGSHTYIAPRFEDGATAEALTSAMIDSTNRFLDRVFWGEGTLGALLTDTHAFVNPALAVVYGVTLPAGSTDFALLDLDHTRRAGILTQAGVLSSLSTARFASPVRRGMFVRDRLLCMPPLMVPQDVNTAAPEANASAHLTVRQRYAMQHEQSTCAGCHQMIDGIGFGLEAYDAAGEYQATEQGAPVDDSGWIVGAADPGLNREFHGAVELAQMLAHSPDTRRCLLRHWFRFAFGRTDTDADACTLDALETAFTASGGNLRELLVQIVRSDAFRFRHPQ